MASLFVLGAPLAQAQTSCGSGGNVSGCISDLRGVFALPNSGSNPSGGASLIIADIIRWLLSIAAILALLVLVIGGLRLIFGGFNNEQEAARAKRIIFWAIIGLAITIGSLIIIQTVAVLLGLI